MEKPIRFAPLGTQIARLIVSGDVDAARKLRATTGRTSWTVAECRGIIGACATIGLNAEAILWPSHRN